MKKMTYAGYLYTNDDNTKKFDIDNMKAYIDTNNAVIKFEQNPEIDFSGLR